jgi:hypothetical protein
MGEGDWFIRADADEFHHIAPPEFVKTRLCPHETIACHQYYDFRITSTEAEDWEQGRETPADRKRPIEERRRWFTICDYTEPRLCRYRKSMRWPETVSFPYNAGYVAAERLPIRHYPHRDPVQLARRCRLRAIMLADHDNACNRHWAQADWKQHIVADNLTGLRYWKPGTALPEPHFTNHLAPLPKRVLQRITHAWFLPLLDKFRPGYSAAGAPRPIPEVLLRKLEGELRR